MDATAANWPLTGAGAQPADDDALMAGVRLGDAHCFELLVQRYQGPVAGYLSGMLGDRDEALDAAQEVFIRLYTNADRHRPEGSLRSWLYKVATNVAIDMIRKRRRRRWVSLGDEALDAVTRGAHAADGSAGPAWPAGGSGPSSALSQLLADERADAVRRAVATLPIRYRTALVLKDLLDQGYEEAADALGVSVGTVKSRVNRARNLLRDKLVSKLGAGGAPGSTRDA